MDFKARDIVAFTKDYKDLEWNQVIKKGTKGIVYKNLMNDPYLEDVIFVVIPSMVGGERITITNDVFNKTKGIVGTTEEYLTHAMKGDKKLVVK